MSLKKTIKLLSEFLAFTYYIVFNPPKFNHRLNYLEKRIGRVKLLSYPPNVGINISNICNQKCLFCPHENKNMISKNWLSADLFSQMKWLRYVSNIELFAGGGEPLVNPNFPEIARVVRKIAPQSHIRTFTNGIALEDENLNAIIKYLDTIHISLNAVNRETYNSIIKGGNYDRVMKNLKILSSRKPQSLDVELSMIVMKKNADNIKGMIDLASILGFHRVIFCHFIVGVMVGKGFGEEESLKDDEKFIITIRHLKEYAEKKGVVFVFPESVQPFEKCFAPWTHGYITNSNIGELIFKTCCSGIIQNTYLGPSIYTNFKKVWNSKRIQYIRKTVNVPMELQNNMCFLCRQNDRTYKDWKKKVRKLASTRNGITFTKYSVPIAFNREMIE